MTCCAQPIFPFVGFWLNHNALVPILDDRQLQKFTMLRRRILPLALWVQLAVAFGSDMLELKTGSEMIPLSDAAMSEILLPDSVSNFTELFEDNNQLQSFGLHARQRQCVDPGYCKIRSPVPHAKYC